MYQTSKKLVLVFATSAPMIEASKEYEVVLEKVLCIHYSLCFQKDNAEVKALIDSGSKVNAMAPAYTSKLGFQVCQTNVRV